MSRWRYFTADEFRCDGEGCCGGESKMDEAFVDRLDELRHRCGFPLIVTSGYRCPTHNAKVSSTGPNGPHTTGKTADLAVGRRRAYIVSQIAFEMGFRGIGWRQHGDARFVHLDDLTEPHHFPRPTVWTYP